MRRQHRFNGTTTAGRIVIAASAIAMVGGCSSSGLDTFVGLQAPAGFHAQQAVNDQNSLAFGGTGALSAPAPMPPADVARPADHYDATPATSPAGLTETAAASPVSGLPVPAAKPVEAISPPAPVVVSVDDAATQRIRAAQNAPTAGGGVAVATATRPPAQITAPSTNRSGLLNALFSPRRAAAAPAPRAAPPAPPTGSVEPSAPVQLASASGLARLAPNGLRKQHDGVDIACLKPALVRLLKKVENHYNKPVVVTSGFRSPTRNASARGAKYSLHIYCAAADIQVEGVSKSELAAFLRDLPGRGGVGTYCHTDSVHIDIGPRREWNWRCRR